MKNIWIKIGLTVLMVISFTLTTLAQLTGTFEDPRDGIVYKNVKIGEQTWFAENLAYNTNNNSSEIEYDPSHVAKFGRLYVWEDAAEACPPGWHLPSREEFETLLINTGGAGSEAFSQLIPGGSSGFSVLFGGWRNNHGWDGNVGNYAYFWSSSSDRPGRAWTLNLYGYSKKANLSRNYIEKAYRNSHGAYVGFCIRCVADD